MFLDYKSPANIKNEKKPEDQVLVIFGATGDLTQKKLIPALFELEKLHLLPEKFLILGSGRSALSEESFREKMLEAITQPSETNSDKAAKKFIDRIFYFQTDPSVVDSYQELGNKLEEIEERFSLSKSNRIYYLSTPPSLYEDIAVGLATFGLNREQNGWKRLIIEKPYGNDTESAASLTENLARHWHEDQIYRIDHYLGKETVQNVLVTRFSNGIFEPLWNRNFIHHVEITSAENFGVGDRGGYYDKSGAIRDMIQNHLLQLAGLIAMEPPASMDADSIRNEIVKVFQSLRPILPDRLTEQVIRGQYVSSHIKGEMVKAYREETGVAEDSKTETYVAIKFFIDNWRWGGVPFYIRSGKHLPTKVTEVVIHFKPTPHYLFTHKNDGKSLNQLIIRIQPDEGILLKFGMKTPGAGFNVQNVSMDFRYSDLSDNRIPDAYERLLLDCMIGDSTLYARIDAVMAAWNFIQPILDAWKNNPAIPVYGYPAGTWGPETADELFAEDQMTWRHPCSALTGDDNFCAL